MWVSNLSDEFSILSFVYAVTRHFAIPKCLALFLLPVLLDWCSFRPKFDQKIVCGSIRVFRLLFYAVYTLGRETRYRRETDLGRVSCLHASLLRYTVSSWIFFSQTFTLNKSARTIQSSKQHGVRAIRETFFRLFPCCHLYKSKTYTVVDYSSNYLCCLFIKKICCTSR